MELRAATPNDAAAMVAIYAPIVETTTISFELEPPTVEVMQQRIASTLARLPWLVSHNAAGQVNGYAYASRYRERAAYQWAVETSVYLHEDARGQGVAKALYAMLFDQLARLGYYQAFAGIALPNAASVGLHESVGFTPIGVYRHVGFKFDAWRDVGWWQRGLQSPSASTPQPAAPRLFRGLET